VAGRWLAVLARVRFARVQRAIERLGRNPIIDETLFNDVQQILASNRVNRERGVHADESSPLAGLLSDADGNRMTPTHASKRGGRYRYYISQTPTRRGSRSRISSSINSVSCARPLLATPTMDRSL